MASVRGAHHDGALPAEVARERENAAERAAEWMKQAQAGDRTAFGLVVEAFQDRVFNAVLKIVGDRDDARELTQEAFLRALANLSGFRGEASPYTWLFRIATNLAIVAPCGRGNAGARIRSIRRAMRIETGRRRI